jgi:hypothetical protein
LGWLPRHGVRQSLRYEDARPMISAAPQAQCVLTAADCKEDLLASAKDLTAHTVGIGHEHLLLWIERATALIHTADLARECDRSLRARWREDTL